MNSIKPAIVFFLSLTLFSVQNLKAQNDENKDGDKLDYTLENPYQTVNVKPKEKK